MKRKLLSLLTFLITAVGAYAYDFFVDGIYYSIRSKTDLTCYVTNYKTGQPIYSGDIVIPEKVTYDGVEYTVTGIYSAAFDDCVNITSIVVPETIEEMNITDCPSLKEIVVPEKTQTLNLSGCISLTELKVPGNVTDCRVDNCSSLKNITFEDGDERLRLNANKTFQLDSIYLGRELNISSLSTFYEHPRLRSVYISDRVKTMAQGAFYFCTALEHVYGMKGLVKFENSTVGAFQHCTSLKSFIVEDNVTELCDKLLADCTSLETLIIGNGVKNLSAEKIVDGCKNLKTVYLGKNITSLNWRSLAYNKNMDIYLFSDVLLSESNNTSNFPKCIYVINPDKYANILSKYNLQPLLTFNETSLEYTGLTPALSYRSNVSGYDVSFDENTTPKEAGSYNTNVDVTFSCDKWTATVEIPCSYTITKAPLSIIADNLQRCYGEENPELTSTIIGFKNDETNDVFISQPVLRTSAVASSDAGTYTIYCSGAEARNYDINYQHGILTIDKAPQKIKWEQNFSDVTVGDIIELTATCSSGMPVKYRSTDLSSVLIASQEDKDYAYILKPATVALTAYQPGNKNYEEADEINKIIIIQTSGIDNVNFDTTESNVYYSIDGRIITNPAKNQLVLKRMNDGTIRKIYIK